MEKEDVEWINQLFQPVDPNTFGMLIEERFKTVYYPSTSAIEEALEKSMA